MPFRAQRPDELALLLRRSRCRGSTEARNPCGQANQATQLAVGPLKRRLANYFDGQPVLLPRPCVELPFAHATAIRVSLHNRTGDLISSQTAALLYSRIIVVWVDQREERSCCNRAGTYVRVLFNTIPILVRVCANRSQAPWTRLRSVFSDSTTSSTISIKPERRGVMLS